MPETVIGAAGSVVVAQCTSPKDGDYVTGASIKVALQGIEDDLATIAALRIAPGSISRVASVPWVLNSTGAALNPSASLLPALTDFAWILLPLPHGQALTSVSVRVIPGLHAGMPDTRPKWRLAAIYWDDPGSGPFTAIDFSDPTTLLADYVVPHDVTHTLASPITIDRASCAYYLRMFGEGGANAQTIQIGPPRLGLTVASLDPGFVG